MRFGRWLDTSCFRGLGQEQLPQPVGRRSVLNQRNQDWQQGLIILEGSAGKRGVLKRVLGYSCSERSRTICASASDFRVVQRAGLRSCLPPPPISLQLFFTPPVFHATPPGTLLQTEVGVGQRGVTRSKKEHVTTFMLHLAVSCTFDARAAPVGDRPGFEIAKWPQRVSSPN